MAHPPNLPHPPVNYDPQFMGRVIESLRQHFTLAVLGTDQSTLINAADDTAAATAGVLIGGLYRNGSVVMVRVS